MRTPPSFPPALLLAVAAALAAVALPPRVDAQANRERTLFVSAVDDRGEPVEGLGPEAFIVRENNQRREILRVSRATEPLDVALLVDNSQAADEEIIFIREALAKFIAALGTEHRIAVIGLADRPTVFVEYTGDAARLKEAIGRLFSMQGSGMTLLDAVFETSRGLERRSGVRAAIVPVITDGIEFTNRYSRDVVSALERAGASLHIAGIGTFLHSEEHSIRERSFFLDAGPRASGGQRIDLLAASALPAAMERLARELAAQYKVVYGRPDSLFGADEVEIASARPGITMRGTPARGETGAVK
jgi:VWFA-related protein